MKSINKVDKFLPLTVKLRGPVHKDSNKVEIIEDSNNITIEKERVLQIVLLLVSFKVKPKD